MEPFSFFWSKTLKKLSLGASSRTTPSKCLDQKSNAIMGPTFAEVILQNWDRFNFMGMTFGKCRSGKCTGFVRFLHPYFPRIKIGRADWEGAKHLPQK